MSPTIIMLMGFLVWTLILLLGIGVSRVYVLGSGRVYYRQLTPDGENLPALAHRIHRAHANCVENLPVVVGVCLLAFMLNQVKVIDGLAYVFLVLRVAQSLVHLWSIRLRAVTVRFLLFACQIAILLYWLIQLFANN